MSLLTLLLVAQASAAAPPPAGAGRAAPAASTAPSSSPAPAAAASSPPGSPEAAPTTAPPPPSGAPPGAPAPATPPPPNAAAPSPSATRAATYAGPTPGTLTSAPTPASTVVAPPPTRPTPGVLNLGAGFRAFASVDRGAGVDRDDGMFSAIFHLVVVPRLDLGVPGRPATTGMPSSPADLGFSVPLLRPQVRGNILHRTITYFVQFELYGTPQLFDAELSWQPSPWIGIRAGQFITPFTREFLVPPFRLLFPDFAPSNVFFRAGRQRGAMLLGHSPNNVFEYAVSVTNVNGIAVGVPTNERDHVLVAGHASVTPWGHSAYTETPQVDDIQRGFSIGGGATYARMNRTTTSAAGVMNTVEVDVAQVGGDAEVHVGPFTAQLEGYLRATVDPMGTTTWGSGGYVQASVMVVPRRLELGARGDVMYPSICLGTDHCRYDGSNRRFEVVAAGYVAGNHLKLQLRYALNDAAPGSTVTPVVGLSHQLALQAQLFF